MKKNLSLIFLALISSSCTTGGMIYDTLSVKEQEEVGQDRRPLGSQMPMMGMPSANQVPVQQQLPPYPPYQQQSQPQPMAQQFAPTNPLAEIGNMGAGMGNPSYGMAAPQPQPMQPVDYQQNPYTAQAQYNQQLSPWAGMPNPSGMQQAPQPSYAAPQMQAPQMQAPQMQAPQMQAPQMQAPQPQIMQPQMQYQQPAAAPALSGLQAPYTTPIDTTPSSPQMMQNQFGYGMPAYQQPQVPQPPQPQMMQPVMQPQAPQPNYVMPNQYNPPLQMQNPEEKKEESLKPLSNNIFDELLPLEQEIEKASKEPSNPPTSNYDDNLLSVEKEPPSTSSEVAKVPIEKIDMDNLADDLSAKIEEANRENPTQYNQPSTAGNGNINDILTNPKRNVYTPASGIIDKMQTSGIPASIKSINGNISTLNTPLGFDSSGQPIVPASFKKQLRNSVANQGLYQPSPPASLATEPSGSINSLQQRINDMRL